MENKTIVVCRGCGVKISLPRNRGELLVTCPRCKYKFQYFSGDKSLQSSLTKKREKERKNNNQIMFLITLFFVIACGLGLLFLLYSHTSDDSILADNQDGGTDIHDLILNGTDDNSNFMLFGNVNSGDGDVAYEMMQVYYYYGSDGSYISADEKFWARCRYLEDNGVFENYILIDIAGNVYNMISADSTMVDSPADLLFSVAENAVMLGREKEYRIFDITDASENHIEYNDITDQYLGDGEEIWSVQHDDSGINIFTVSLVDTYSYQDMMFKIYDGNMNLKFSFSKSELSDRYDYWYWDRDNIDLESLGGCIYGIRASYYGGNNMGLYIDTERKKAFINRTATLNGYFNWSSNGRYILCTGGYSGDEYLLIDIDSETVTYHGTIDVALADIGESDYFLYTETSLDDFFDVSESFCYASSFYGGKDHYVLLQFESATINSILVYNGSTVTNFSEFHNGMSILELENSGGAKFITMLRSDGELQFEPISGSIENGVHYIDTIEKFLVLSEDLEHGYLIGTGGIEQEIDDITIDDTFFHIIDYNGRYQIVCLNKLKHSLKYLDI